MDLKRLKTVTKARSIYGCWLTLESLIDNLARSVKTHYWSVYYGTSCLGWPLGEVFGIVG